MSKALVIKRPILLWLLVCTIVLTASASNEFRFRHFDTNDGLPAPTVRAITQDQRGFLWFGTDNGLCRYDGVSMVRCHFNDENLEQFVSFLHDTDGFLWIGTAQGIYLYNHANGHYTRFAAKTSTGRGITSEVLRIASDKESNVWVATLSEGVFRYSPKTHRLDNYPMQEIGGKVGCVMIDNSNQVWAITGWGQPALWRYNKAKNNFAPANLQGATHIDLQGMALLQTSNGTIWVGTWDSGLIRLDANQTVTPIGGFRPQHIHSLAEYAPHQILVGSDDGLSVYDMNTGAWRTFSEDETNPFSISSRFVYPIMKDREGGLWIGTFYGGINYVAPNINKFAAFATSRLHNSVGGKVINRFCEDAHGNIWIASDDGGLSQYSPETNAFKVFTPLNSGLSYHNVHALCADGNFLWIGTYTGGINKLDLQTGAYKHYSLPDNTKGNSSCYSIFKDRQGRIWAASMEDFFAYDTKNDCFKLIKRLGTLTIDIDQDAKGNLWLATQGKGLHCFTPSNGKWKTFRQGKEASTLASDQVNALLIDTNGRLFVATQKGLCQYNPTQNNFQRLDIGFDNIEVNDLVEENNAYWLATNQGIVRYCKGEVSRCYNQYDGLQSDQTLPNAMLKASDGRIYVGTQNGFNAFSPYEVTLNETPPTVCLTTFEVTNKPKDEISNIPTDLTIEQTNCIELPHDANSIVINFASLSFCAPGKNRFRYRLDGLDNDWTEASSRTYAPYTNLSPGTYTFRVKGTNNDGVWSEKEATLTIIIRPPFYLSLPMKVVYFLLIAGLVAAVIRFIHKRAKKKHQMEMDNLRTSKEKEMREAKIQFFTMIAHEIRTPVSLIIGPLENIMKSPHTIPTVIRKDMDMIDRNAHRLLYLVNQLLDFRKVQTNSFVTKFKQQSVAQLLQAVSERFEPTFQQKGISFTVNYPDDRFTATLDAEAITKVVSNLLTNATKYARDKVELSCRVDNANQQFSLIVADNGMGVRPEDQKRIFQPFFQAADNKPGTGIGLSIVKSIVEQHHGDVAVESTWGKGSTFTVTLPIQQPDIALDTLADDHQISDVNVERPATECVKQASADKRPTMLIVEDNEDMSAFIAANFESNYNILTAADGQEALETLNQQEVTLILSDWMMPRMDGVTLCRHVRSNANISHIPFILLTAKTDDDSKAQGMECGADIYLEKPFSLQVLKSSIANMIELRRMLREKFSGQPLEPITHIASNPLDSKLLSQMQQIIEENMDNENLNVNFIAEQLHISRSTLFAKIKTLADITPSEMIQMIRLKAAAKMLANNDAQVTEVCYKVGFSSPSYFSKCFQKQFGIKPSDMKNTQKQHFDKTQ